jgi:hypothetical protein
MIPKSATDGPPADRYGSSHSILRSTCLPAAHSCLPGSNLQRSHGCSGSYGQANKVYQAITWYTACSQAAGVRDLQALRQLIQLSGLLVSVSREMQDAIYSRHWIGLASARQEACAIRDHMAFLWSAYEKRPEELGSNGSSGRS